MRGVVAGLSRVPPDGGKRPCDGDERASSLENTCQLALSAADFTAAGGDSANRGMAVIAALIRGGRLWGALVFRGCSVALELVLLGVMPTIALAVVLDALFALWLAARRRAND